MKTDNASLCNCNKNKSNHVAIEGNDVKGKNFVHRFADTAKLLCSAVAFTIIPKCPLCLAAYIALATGAGIPVTTATYLRMALVILCVVSMSYFIIKILYRFIAISNKL